MALDPGSCIFRRFAKLNAKNLLYLQAEVAYIEEDLQHIITEDKNSASPEKANYPYSVWELKESLHQKDEYPEQWMKVLEARKLLNEYNAALLQQAQLLQFSKPETADLEVLQEWLNREHSEKRYFSPEDQWSGENAEDLIALHSRHDNTDKFTRLVFTRVIPFFHRWLGYRDTSRKDIEAGVWYYNNRRIRSWTYITAAKLIIIFLYNFIFVLVMGLMVKARRVEIFATAAAFAAIQVTILTSGNGSS
ncbi:similar to An12g02190 [Aspergillus luchuensis IFO 4308]|nr:similar to An12g02190 [Aspergillus luchuensis IFO 4308]